MKEDALHLVLHHARADLPHDGDVRIAADLVGEAHHLQLELRLDHPRLVHSLVQHLPVRRVRLDPLKRGGGPLGPAVRVNALVEEKCLRGELGDKGGDLVHIADSFNLVLLLEVLGARDRAHPHCVVGRQAGDEERRRPVSDVDGPQAVGLSHAKEVVKVALLPEDLLVVRVIPRLARAAEQQGDALARLPVHQGDEALPVLRVHGAGHLEGVVALPVVRGARCVAPPLPPGKDVRGHVLPFLRHPFACILLEAGQ
mmetsp:Transcript_16612/g.42039  ORF Transcript_16612/g.42039 Transcript_16612/m.42039 type:complete len:256 (-) Transcript_16612:17-784(-)